MLQPLFVAPLWRKVQPVVRPDEYVQPASVARIGVEDVAGPILVEHARAGPFPAWVFLQAVVVIHLTFLQLLLRRRYVVVVVEVGGIRRHPMEPPAPALLELLDLRQGRAPNHEPPARPRPPAHA